MFINSSFSIRLLIGAGLILLASCKNEPELKAPEQIRFTKPNHFPEPVYNFSANPVTTDGFLLGRALFYDGKLSRDGSISCGFCHQVSSAFTQHGHDVSHGVDDRLGTRNSPGIINPAWQNNFFWDGGVFHLDVVSVAAITNPVEMDEEVGQVLEKLRQDKNYPAMFNKAFGSPDITSTRFFQALAQFMLMCNSWESKWDHVKTGKDVFTPLELQGEAIFNQKCSSCHPAPLFTTHGFANNGLRPTALNDKGRYEITHSPGDLYAFKIPTLRNNKFTAPYMHDGRFRTLDAALEHYNSGVVESESLHPLLKQESEPGIKLTNTEKEALKAFLNTLNDEAFIRNKLLEEPF
jgi:cytochrome c peroxidase